VESCLIGASPLSALALAGGILFALPGAFAGLIAGAAIVEKTAYRFTNDSTRKASLDVRPVIDPTGSKGVTLRVTF
jgi:hypothetical protein